MDVFKVSHDLVLETYKITNKFPEDEKYRIISQMIRAAYSIPSNLIEGNSRNTTKEYLNFLFIARASLQELKYFYLLSKDLKYITKDEYIKIKEQCNKVGMMLNKVISFLKSTLPKTK